MYDEMEKAGVLIPVVNLQLNYHVPARYDQVLRIESHVIENPTSRLKFRFSIFHESTLLVKAEVYLAFVDSATSRPRRAPEAFAKALNDYGLVHE